MEQQFWHLLLKAMLEQKKVDPIRREVADDDDEEVFPMNNEMW